MVFKKGDRRVMNAPKSAQPAEQPSSAAPQGAENITVKPQPAQRPATTEEKVAMIENYLNQVADPYLKTALASIEGLKNQFNDINTEISKLTGVQVRVSTAIDQKFNEIITIQNAITQKLMEIENRINQFEIEDEGNAAVYTGEDLFEDDPPVDNAMAQIDVPKIPPVA
jgi:archaellum component FlaC